MIVETSSRKKLIPSASRLGLGNIITAMGFILWRRQNAAISERSDQVKPPTKRRDNDNEDEEGREHRNGNGTRKTPLAQVGLVQSGRQSLQAGLGCPSHQGSRGMACLSDPQHRWPHLLPGPRAHLGRGESECLTMRHGVLGSPAEGFAGGKIW